MVAGTLKSKLWAEDTCRRIFRYYTQGVHDFFNKITRFYVIDLYDFSEGLFTKEMFDNGIYEIGLHPVRKYVECVIC